LFQEIKKMKKILFIMLILVSLVSCTSPIIPDVVEPVIAVGPEVPAGPDGTVATPPNPFGDSVKSANYIRQPGSIVSRGLAGAFTDPDEGLCNEPETIYIFYDDNSIVRYKPNEGQYSMIADSARYTCDLHNRDNPTIPWDYITVAPLPPPPPVTSNDPVLEPLHLALVDDTGYIWYEYTMPNNAEYDYAVSVIHYDLEIWNRDHDPDCHVVYGGRLVE
jgi:hypothetical protein